jgi:EAL and modified HD-GYP domain-containing signal transduction protein
MNKKCIVTHITTEEQYHTAIALGTDALEGPFVAEKLATKTHSGTYLQSNFFRLMVEVTKDDPDIDAIEQIISMDATLSYTILKMANSAYYALRQKATTIHQAVVTLGLVQLKQWVYLLSASGMDGDNSDASSSEEFLKLSFMRASFCSELMNYATNMPISKNEAYMMGMFSTLNYLIDAPLEEILGEVPVSDEIKEALLHKTGRCGMLYELVLSYEAADWKKISSLAEQLGIPNGILTSVYFVCMENVNTIWEQLTNASDPNSQPAPSQPEQTQEEA